MNGKTLSVEDFAAAAGVSKQAIYKSIRNGKLSSYTVYIDGKTYILNRALNLYKNSTTTETISLQENKPVQSTFTNEMKAYLERQIEDLKRDNQELKEQNRQLQESIIKLAEKAQELTQNAQILHLQSGKIPFYKRLFARKENNV